MDSRKSSAVEPESPPLSAGERLAWFRSYWAAQCARCQFAVRVTTSDGRTQLACENCPVAWA